MNIFMSNNLERHWTQLLGQFFTVLLNCKLVGAQSNCFIAVAIRVLQYAYRSKEEGQKRKKRSKKIHPLWKLSNGEILSLDF